MKLELLKNKFKGKKILITGNTGFVGSWLAILLNLSGAKILGYSLKKKDTRFLSNTRQFKKKIKTIYYDINNFDKNLNKIKKFKPQIVIHLASQPLVIDSYTNTKKTYFTNVMGTVNFFETIKDFGISSSIFFDSSRPTTKKTRYRAEGKTLLRVNEVRDHLISREIQQKISTQFRQELGNADVVIFSDFGYGLFSDEFTETLIKTGASGNLVMSAELVLLPDYRFLLQNMKNPFAVISLLLIFLMY